VPKRVSERPPAPNPKAQRSSQATRKKRQRASQSTRKKRAQHGSDGEPRAHLLPKAIATPAAQAAQATQPGAPSDLPTWPSLLGNVAPPNDEMLTALYLEEMLRSRHGNETVEQRREREERQKKRLADLKADAERQVTEARDRIVAQLPEEARAFLAAMTRRRQLDISQQLRWATALLDTEGLDEGPRFAVLVSLLTDDEQERTKVLLRLARRYNRGRPKDDLRWARAKEAWLAAHMRGRAHRAVPDAMKASGFGKSAVYERARRESWSAELGP
jgi:hypothetical protein